MRLILMFTLLFYGCTTSVQASTPTSLMGFHVFSIAKTDLIMTANKPRPGHFAELEELEAARKTGTLAAYDLFLARHPASRYAGEAQKERAVLAKRQLK